LTAILLVMNALLAVLSNSQATVCSQQLSQIPLFTQKIMLMGYSS